jgi:hypothetical protein
MVNCLVFVIVYCSDQYPWRRNNPEGLIAVVLTMYQMAPQGPQRVSKGPQENEEKLGDHSNFWLDHKKFLPE